MRRLIIVYFTILISSSVESALITIEQGTLNGTHLKARGGKIFNTFYGIPYAQPPVGKLRFKPPVEAGPWKGVRDATQLPPVCIQVIKGTNSTKGTEDCLYLDVHTPLNAREGDKLPVIVYLHGGKFREGTTYDDGPQYIMQHDVIIVYPNFRLGAFGLLSTGDTLIPGNFALKDQVLALKWIQKNIRHFGGDPNRVTLQGHSSGAMNAYLHSISTRSNGLFKKMILQSGIGSCSMAYFVPNIARKVSEEFAKEVRCPSTNSSQDIYKCLMNIDSNVVALAVERMYIWDIDPKSSFRPTIEDKNAEQAFLTEIPCYAEHQSVDIPWMIGMTSEEAAFKVARYLDKDGKLAAELDKNFELLFPITLEYLWNTKNKHLNYISQAIRTHYFGNREMSEKTSDQMTKMYTEGLYSFCYVNAIHSYPGPKHVYLFNYIGKYTKTVQNSYANYQDKFLGVSHAAEMPLLFERKDTLELLEDRDIKFSNELVKRWVNFAITSDPNQPIKINESVMAVWEPVTSEKIEFVSLKWNGTMGTNMYEKSHQFWKSLPIGSKHYKYGCP